MNYNILLHPEINSEKKEYMLTSYVKPDELNLMTRLSDTLMNKTVTFHNRETARTRENVAEILCQWKKDSTKMQLIREGD